MTGVWVTGAGGSVPSMAICVLQGPVASMSQVLYLPPSILRKNSHWLTLLSCSMAQFCAPQHFPLWGKAAASVLSSLYLVRNYPVSCHGLVTLGGP